jgi:hypothetical protein
MCRQDDLRGAACSKTRPQKHARRGAQQALTAVSQLLDLEAAAAEWHFSQENAAFRSSSEGIQTVEPLWHLRELSVSPFCAAWFRRQTTPIFAGG